MIDTSRHFLPVELIYHIIDGMSYHKFNTLHWHLVDEVSFPFVVEDFPLLSGKGAWHKNLVYEPNDIQGVKKEYLLLFLPNQNITNFFEY